MPQAPPWEQYAAKAPAKEEDGPWTKYAAPSDTGSTDMRSAGEVAKDQALSVVKGIPQAVTGIPSAVASSGNALWDIIKGKGTQKAQELVKGALSPVTTSLRGMGALAAPGSIEAPTREEWEGAAEGAGANLGATVLGAGMSKVPALKPLFERPALDPAEVNKWMGVSAREVEHGANPAQQIIKENLLGKDKMATKANVDKALVDAGKDMEAELKTGDANGVKIDAEHSVKDAFDSAQAKLKSPTDAAFASRVKSTLDKILERYPELDDLTPSRAHELKVELGKNINWKSTVDDPLNDAFIQAYSEVNSAIKGAVKGIGPKQARWGNLNVASRNLADSLNENTVGRGSPAETPQTSSPAWEAAKKAAPYVIPAGGTAALGYKLWNRFQP